MIDFGGGENLRLNRERLAAVMARKDVKQKTLAEMTGTSRATINGVCCGRSCSPKTAIAIADALNMELVDLTENN